MTAAYWPMHIAFIGVLRDLGAIQWGGLCAGMFLLLFPADRLLSTKVRLRSLESFHSLENSPHGHPWWWVPVLWLDPVRGFAGAWLLLHALGLALLEPPALLALSTAAVVLAASVILQCLTTREPGALLAPIGFVVGLILVLLPLSVALPAIVLAVLAMLAFHHFHLFFGTGTLAVVGFGFILQVEPWRFIMGGGALLLPILFGLATGRALELPTRLVENRH